MSSPALRRLAAVVATALALIAGLGGCGRDPEFRDRTAVVKLGGSTETYQVDSCGRDGRTVFVVARSPGGAVLQAVVGVTADHHTGVPRSTGVTVDLVPSSADTRVAAFGSESWHRRGSTGAVPGTIASARVRGSRIQISGEAVDVDADDHVVAGGATQPISVDARCDLRSS